MKNVLFFLIVIIFFSIFSNVFSQTVEEKMKDIEEASVLFIGIAQDIIKSNFDLDPVIVFLMYKDALLFMIEIASDSNSVPNYYIAAEAIVAADKVLLIGDTKLSKVSFRFTTKIMRAILAHEYRPECPVKTAKILEKGLKDLEKILKEKETDVDTTKIRAIPKGSI